MKRTRARAADGVEEEPSSIVAALRAVVRRAVPRAEESLAWGALSFHRPWIGGRVKGALCQIAVVRGEVRLEFVHGVRMRDPRRLLRGERISKRYVPIRGVADARRPEIAQLVREAATIVWADAGRRRARR